MLYTRRYQDSHHSDNGEMTDGKSLENQNNNQNDDDDDNFAIWMVNPYNYVNPNPNLSG